MQTRRRTARRAETLSAYLFIAPQFLGLVLFVLVPVFFSLYISFTNWDMISPIQWVGLRNYCELFAGKELPGALFNTARYLVLYIPATVALSLLAALGLSAGIRGVSLYRTAFFLPNVTSTVAVSLVWIWMYNPEFGIINVLLQALGLPGGKWLNSLSMAMPSVAIVAIWQSVGYFMIVFLAGIKGINPTYYEAARIDGAGWWRTFWRVTLPMLTPTLFFVLTMIFIGGFQVFNEVYMLTQGGPANSTRSIVLLIYQTAFRYFRMGEASVMAWVLFAVVLLVTLVQFKFQDKWVNYDV